MNDQQLTFQFINFATGKTGVANVIYITDDPKYNKLSWQMMLNTGEVSLTPAKEIVDPSQLPYSGNDTLLYLDLSPLKLSEDEIKDLSVTSDRWTGKIFPSDNMIGITPLKKIEMTSGTAGAQTIAIDNLAMAKSPGQDTENLLVQVYVKEISSTFSSFKVALQNPPGPGDKNLQDYITTELSTNNIINSYNTSVKSNSFNLTFKPGSQSAQITPSTDTVFNVSFVYGKTGDKYGFGALTSIKNAQDITITKLLNADKWQIIPQTKAQEISWDLVPPPDKPIIGNDADGVVSFDISNIITAYQPGPTLMFITYKNIPGYQDGVYTILLNKIAHVVINKLEVKPNPAALVDGVVDVQLTWDVDNFETLTLMPFIKDVTNLRSFNAQLTKTTDITLMATGNGQGNLEYKTINAKVLQKINSFETSPSFIYYNDFPHLSDMIWDVQTDGDVTLINETDQSSQKYPKVDTITQDIHSPGMWTIVPENGPALKRHSLVQAFKMNSNKKALPLAPRRIAASPIAEFIAVVGDTENNVFIIDSLTGDNYCDPIPVGDKPVDVLFSNNGNFLVTADEAGKSVSVISVRYDEEKSLYVFGTPVPVLLDGQPQRIVFSSDDKTIFVTTCDPETRSGTLSVLSNKNNTFSPVQSVPVGKNPQGVTADPTGVQVFVANAADNTISVVGYNSLEKKYQLVRNAVVGLNSPVDLAIGGHDKKCLLAIGRESSEIYAFDSHDLGSPQVFQAGSSPAGIRMTNDGAYAIVSNKNSDTLTLIDCYEGKGSCKTLEHFGAGSKPQGISISRDGYVVFIANSGEKYFTAINLENYEMNSFCPRVGKGPNSVAASPDGKNVVSWFNSYSFSIKKVTSDKGVYVYDTQGQTGTAELTNYDVIGFIFHPDIKSGKAFAVTKDANEVMIVDTGTYSIELSFPIPNNSLDQKQYPVALSLSDDGKTMFACVTDKKQSYNMVVYDINIKDARYTVKENITLKGINSDILMAGAPDASHAFIADINNEKVYYLYLKDGKYEQATEPFALGAIPSSMVVSPNNDFVYILTLTGLQTGFSVIDIQEKSLKKYPLPSSYTPVMSLQQLCVSPDGSRLFVTDSDVVGIRVVSTQSLRIVQTLSYAGNVQLPYGITILPDASTIFLAGYRSGTLARISQVKAEVSKKDIQIHTDEDALSSDAINNYKQAAGSVESYTLKTDSTTTAVTNSVCVPIPVEGGMVNICVECDVIAGGYIEFSVPGPTKKTSIYFPKTKIPKKGFTVSSMVKYPPGAHETTLKYTYYSNHYEPSDDSKIKIFTTSIEENEMTEKTFSSDDTYTGFFVRDFVGETPSGSTAGKSWTNSPDIITNGPDLLPDPAVLTDKTNYDNGLPAVRKQTPLQNNYVYLRAINETAGAQTSTIYFYYVDTTLILWPQNWKTQGITHASQDTNGAPLIATSQGEIVAVNPPFQWTPPRQGVHYCLTCWVQNGPDQGPPDLYDIGSVPDMAKFIFEHKNVAWRNTIEVDASQPTIQNSTPISGPEKGGIVHFGIECDVPPGGTIKYTVPGPTKDTTIIFPETTIPFSGYTPMAAVNYPAQPGGYQTTLEFTYDKKDTNPPAGSNIIPLVGTNKNPAGYKNFVDMVYEKAPHHIVQGHIYDTPHLADKTDIQGVPPRKIFLVGSVKYKM